MTRRELLALGASSLAFSKDAFSRATSGLSVPTRCLAPLPDEGGCAMPYSGGATRDSRGRPRLYYLRNFRELALATSDDEGASWRRPDLGRGSNVVLRPDLAPGEAVDSVSVARDPAGNYGAMVTSPGLGRCRFYSSEDGLAWRPHTAEATFGDRSSLAFWAPLGVWVVFARVPAMGTGGDPRRFSLWVARSFPLFELVSESWLRAEEGDGVRGDGGDPQLYGVDLLEPGGTLALTVLRDGARGGRPKLNSVVLAKLREDLSVARASFATVARPSDDPASWCWGNVQGVAGGLLERRLVVSGRGAGNVCATGYVDLPPEALP